MGNVAMLLAEAGHEVKGSDERFFPPMSDELRARGIPILEGYKAENLMALFTPDVQVITNALSRDHVEAAGGRERGWRVLSFPEVLEEFILPGRKVFVVAGTHGKTTTTSLLARLLESEGAGWLVGGVLRSGEPGCRLGQPKAPFAIEGDEYGTSWFDPRAKFLHYRPRWALLTHLEWDHLDIYPSFAAMQEPFRELLRLVPGEGGLIYCSDVPELRKLVEPFAGRKIAYGTDASADFRLARVISQDARGSRVVFAEGGREVELETPLAGGIYLMNLLGAAAAARTAGVGWEEIGRRARDLYGAKRRLEPLRRGDPFHLYSDFAHHPTAVRETLKVLRELHPGAPLWAIFDPRNASSRRNAFHALYAEVFRWADRVILGPPHPDAKLADDQRMDVKKLAADIGRQAQGCSSERELRACFQEPVPPGTVLAVMSCGAFFGLPGELAKSTDGRVEIKG